MENNKNNSGAALAKKMAVSLVCGLVAGFAFMMLREKLNASGNSALWKTINDLLFQDITAEGAEQAFGIFYIIGQLFIKALQLVIIPMVFTSISLAIGSISDTRTMGRIASKTLFWFLLGSFLALLLAGVVGYTTFSMGLFNAHIEGLAEASGSTGSNPLNVVLNIIPSNIITAFGSNGAVLSSVFLAVATGLSMNELGESRTATMRRLMGEVNDVVVVFLNFVVTKFAPFAVFVLLTRTFAIYGVDYLKPALVYVVTTVILLFVFLLVGYPTIVAVGAKLNPFTFIKKIANVAVFGFSTSSSAATLPLSIKVCTEDMGVDDSIASFVLPLGMTINMDGTAIMQVIATVFIAGCAGYNLTPMELVVIALLARLTATPLLGVLTGLAVTAVLQSSSAATVMVIGFVSAGLLELPRAVAVIYGINIGTTMTAQLIAFDVQTLVYPVLFLGFLLDFAARRPRWQAVGEAVFSFGLLFEGIDILGRALQPLAGQAVFLDWMTRVKESPLLGILLGLSMTMVVQSSSATIALLQNVARQAGPDGIHSVLGLAGAVPVLLGDNIGTTVTALLACIGQGKDATRAALAHSCFNLSGSLLAAVLLPWFVRLVELISPKGPELEVISRQIANAHTAFNVCCTLLWLPFLPWMVRLVCALVPEDR